MIYFSISFLRNIDSTRNNSNYFLVKLSYYHVTRPVQQHPFDKQVLHNEDVTKQCFNNFERNENEQETSKIVEEFDEKIICVVLIYVQAIL